MIGMVTRAQLTGREPGRQAACSAARASLSVVHAARTHARPPIPATLRGRLGEFESEVDPLGQFRANAGWTFARNSFLGNHHRNTGPADTQPPRIGRVEAAPLTVPLAKFTDGGLVRHAWIQDSTWDDGQTFETADLLIETDKLGETGSSSVAMAHSGGQIFRGVVDPQPASTGLVGMSVSYRIEAIDPNGNSASSGVESFVICGSETYGAGSMALAAVGQPTLGGNFSVSASGGPAGKPGLMVVGAARASLFGGLLLVDPTILFTFPLAFDAGGSAGFSVPLPDDATFAGLVIDLQIFALDPSQPHGVSAASNGLEVALCAP